MSPALWLASWYVGYPVAEMEQIAGVIQGKHLFEHDFHVLLDGKDRIVAKSTTASDDELFAILSQEDGSGWQRTESVFDAWKYRIVSFVQASDIAALAREESLVFLRDIGIVFGLFSLLTVFFLLSVAGINRKVSEASRRISEAGNQVVTASGQIASATRQLADGSAAAASDTAALIEQNQAASAAGLDISAKVTRMFADIRAKTRRVNELVAEIEGATGEQTKGMEQIAGAIRQLEDVTQQNAAVAQESSAGTDALHEQAEVLGDVVAELNRFIRGDSE